MRSYVTDLKNIQFPLTFKICIEADTDFSRRLGRKSGYANFRKFYKGEWKNDPLVRGWTGFNPDGTPKNDTKG